jgi:hypothetical protein
MDANTPQYSWERDLLPDYGQCLGRLTLSNKMDIARDIYTCRASVGARHYISFPIKNGLPYW